jgi:hypothetical protein
MTEPTRRGTGSHVPVWALVILLAVGVLPPARASDPNRSPALCGPHDRAEAGIQGDVPLADQRSGVAQRGYNCGLTPVGHLGFRAPASSLAWSGHCAYVQLSGGGVAVVDVSNPRRPVQTGLLKTGGASENIHAVTNGKRAVLVAARRDADRSVVPVDVFDVRHCATPTKLGTIRLPNVTIQGLNPGGPAHNIELSPQGTKLYGSMPLQEADLTNLDDPSTWRVRTFECDVAAQFHPAYAATSGSPVTPCDVAMLQPVVPQIAHEFEFNSAGTRMYVGGQVDTPYEQSITVLDMTVWPPKVISRTPGPGHGIRRATIRGVPYLLHSNETVSPQTAASALTGVVQARTGVTIPRGVGDNLSANGCVPNQIAPNGGQAQAYLTDISREGAPRTVSHLELAINSPANCAAQVQSQVNSTVHYNTVDDPQDSTFAMLSMKNAGLRVWDIRRPTAPTEVAYFNPGQRRADDGTTTLDRVRMHTHYDKRTGLIWLLSESGGFWVLELQPQVRAVLGLHMTRSLPALRAPARVAFSLSALLAIDVGDRLSYCRL